MTNEGLGEANLSVYMLGLERLFRGQELVNFLEKNHLSTKIVWGIDTQKLDSEYLESLVDQRKAKLILGRKLSHSEVSCALGHLEMYEEFLLSDSEWGLFLEDDAQLTFLVNNLCSKLSKIDRPTVLSLSNVLNQRFGPRPFPFANERSNLPWMPDFRKCAVPPIGAFAYLMNRSAAETAVHSLRGKRVYAPADFPFEFRNLVEFYGSAEPYADIQNVESTIDADRIKQYGSTLIGSPREKCLRWLRVIFDYSGLGILWARHIGLSGRFYRYEKVVLREKYKKFRKNPLSEF